MVKQNWTIWFTGLHGAGKTTIACSLAEKLRSNNISVVVLDGDELRKTISADLGYSIKERNEHMKRAADVCRLVSDNGVLTIASVASPTEKSREYARSILKNILMVYVNCPVEVCMKRDVKGHYKKAAMKEEGFENFINAASNFEEPKNPDIVLKTDKETVKASVDRLMEKLKEKKVIAF